MVTLLLSIAGVISALIALIFPISYRLSRLDLQQNNGTRNAKSSDLVVKSYWNAVQSFKNA